MTRKIFTLPLILITLSGAAMGYYFGVVTQRGRAIVVKMDKPTQVLTGNTQPARIVASSQTATSATPRATSTPTTTKALVPSKTIVKPKTTTATPVKTAPVTTKPVVAKPVVTAPVVHQPAAPVTTPTPTTKVS